jgi:nitrogen regulatory protein PII
MKENLKEAKSAGLLDHLAGRSAGIVIGKRTGSPRNERLATQTNAVLFLLEESIVDKVLSTVYTAGRLKKPGTGISFVIDVERAAGI